MNSMTGFGVARGKVGRSHVLIEVRSVNHRYCEVNLRFPGRFASFEPEVGRLVRQRFARGKFDFFLREETLTREEEEITLAKKSHQLLKKIQKELGLSGPVSLEDLLTFREIYFSRPPQEEMETIRQPLMGLIHKALDGLDTMRAREGSHLKKWLEERARRLLRLLGSIEKHACEGEARVRNKIQKRLRGIGHLDEERLVQEAAVVAGRADVTEEIVRLRSHLKECRRFLGQKEAIGRKLDFLAQEMGREINTIGSKSQGVKLVHEVIEFKGELERIREQIQNIE